VVADSGSSAAAHGEPLARSAWDAAIRAAVILLDDEMSRLVRSKQYDMGAAVRDCRAGVERLFNLPRQWTIQQRRMDERIEKAKQMLRTLSDQQLQEVRRGLRPDSPMAIALAEVLTEREKGI
jgi:hypothetical protein